MECETVVNPNDKTGTEATPGVPPVVISIDNIPRCAPGLSSL